MHRHRANGNVHLHPTHIISHVGVSPAPCEVHRALEPSAIPPCYLEQNVAWMQEARAQPYFSWLLL